MRCWSLSKVLMTNVCNWKSLSWKWTRCILFRPREEIFHRTICFHALQACNKMYGSTFQIQSLWNYYQLRLALTTSTKINSISFHLRWTPIVFSSKIDLRRSGTGAIVDAEKKRECSNSRTGYDEQISWVKPIPVRTTLQPHLFLKMTDSSWKMFEFFICGLFQPHAA